MYRLKGTTGPWANRVFPLEEGLTLGAGEACDIRLEEAGVDAGHVVISMRADGRLALDSFGLGGVVAINGEAVTGAPLRAGDEIRIGQAAFLVQAPGLRPERVLVPAAPAKRRLTWVWITLAVVSAVLYLLARQQGWMGP